MSDASSFPDRQPLSIERVLDLLARGQVESKGLMPWGSNYTFLTSVTDEDLQVLAIYKPREGERPLWDFPEGTLCNREVAAFVVSEALNWFIVPPTVLRDGPQGVGMLQLYVEVDPNEHYFTLRDKARFTEQFERIVLFDLLINNADRKSGHCLRDGDDHIWAIDHGVAFSVEPKLRTVLWDYADRPIPAELHEDLCAFRARFDRPDDPAITTLRRLLDRREITALKRRTDRLIEADCFPRPQPGYRQIPWPPV
jgi:uncharacterized repeat protein (TIGR03843 family)